MRLRYDLLAATSIQTPLPLQGRKMDKPSRDPLDVLRVLAPHKAVFFSRRNPGLLSLSLLPEGPFGPEPELLLSFLFSNFRAAVGEVVEDLNPERLEIISTGPWPGAWPERVIHRRSPGAAAREGLPLTPVEFKGLHSALSRGIWEAGALVSIFLDFDHLFCLYLPVDTPWGQVLDSLAEVRRYRRQHPERTPYNPISGRQYDLEKELVGADGGLVLFSGSGYLVGPAWNPLFPLPYFNRRVGIRKIPETHSGPLPCCNCLACARYCPADLYPSLLYHHLLGGKREEALAADLPACIRCGRCSFVCPSRLPLEGVLSRTLQEEAQEELLEEGAE